MDDGAWNHSVVQRCNRSTEDDLKGCVLYELQEHVTFRYIALFTYLMIVLLVGLVGNSLIICVYSRRSRKTATIVLMQAIAVADLSTNVLATPVTIYVLMHSVSIENYMCKIFYFFNYTISSLSAALLVAVAVVRYRKICYPFGHQITTQQAKKISYVIAISTVLICIPHILVHGRRTVDTIKSLNITIFECSMDDQYAETIWPKIVSGFSLIIFLFFCLPLVVMYSRIGIQAQKRCIHHGVAAVHKHEDFSEQSQSLNLAITPSPNITSSPKLKVEKDSVTNSSSQDNELDTSGSFRHKANLKRNGSFFFSHSRKGMNILNRTTLMLIVISAVYILTNLTTLVLIFVKIFLNIKLYFFTVMTASVYTVFLYSYVLNSAVNAVIYIALDGNFRKDCIRLIKRI